MLYCVSNPVPHNVKAVDTPTLIELERESRSHGYNQNLPPAIVTRVAPVWPGAKGRRASSM